MTLNTPTLTTQRLILRKFTREDTQALFELLKDEEVNRFLPWFPLQSIEEAQAFLQSRFMAYYQKPQAYRYALCLKTDNRPIGYVCLGDEESRDFGYCIKKEHWNKGLVTEGAGAVMTQIKKGGLDYITATHDVNNPQSGRVMKKLGMDYRYSYQELWQPKNIAVTFRMYQLDFTTGQNQSYRGYWQQYPEHFIEKL